MIQIETLSPDTLKITPPTKLKADDFAAIAPQIDELIREKGQIRLLIDARALHGWENSEALEKHILFVKDHQSKVKRIAVIAGHDWQHWLAAIVNIFVHPQIKAFGIDQEAAARQWLMEWPIHGGTSKGAGTAAAIPSAFPPFRRRSYIPFRQDPCIGTQPSMSP